MNHPPRKLVVAALAAQLLLSACTATAHTAPPVDPWPQPRPNWPERPIERVRPHFPLPSAAPNFHAPSATHCSRPVMTSETPGWTAGQLQSRREAPATRDRFARPAPAAEAAADSAAPSAPPMAGAAKSLESHSMADAGSARSTGPVFAAPQPPAGSFAAPAPQAQQAPHVSPVVTAGVVDDNADFQSYLSFRNRTRVHHRPRDIRERYLLEVKDLAGRGIADAEVAVQATSGHAAWARTDAAGKVWLHPDAFDPARSAHYEVAVRKDGRHGFARLGRGQKSAVEVRLDARAAWPQARLDLVFLIDATGSMADEIHKLKTTLRTIVGELASLPSRPDLCLGLVAYRDRGDAFLVRSHDFTDDVDGYLQGALMPLRADGGGDYPEAMNEALHETVHRLSWRGDGATRLVILLADAPPHLDYGAPHYDEDMLAALGKGIKIFSVGASGLDKQGEFIQRQIAQYTGGKFVFLTYARAHDPRSGPGRETVHDVRNYSVDTLDRLVVRLVTEELAKLALAN